MEKKSKKKYFRLFVDILKENGRFSQGRVYLFWSIIAYYITLGTLLVCGIYKSEIDIKNFNIVVDALKYAMTLFGGYVFGGKFIDVVKVLNTKKVEKDDNNSNKKGGNNEIIPPDAYEG
jgi:hypothetical protein